jgi:poly [ADP-ribose] polymerase
MSIEENIILKECYLYKKINNLVKIYIMQILKNNDKFILCIKQGAIGEVKDKTIIFDNEEDVNKLFLEKFEEKTGNVYGQDFVKKIDKYDIDLPQDDDFTIIEPNVQYLLNIISNELIINKTLENIGIDSKRMPVEKINKLRITKAEDILHELNLTQDNTKVEKVEELSEEYNRYIPYKMQIVLKDKNTIATHINNIDVIKNIYETYSCIIKNKKKNALRNKPEYVYESLGIEIKMIDDKNEKYPQILECIKRDNNKIKVLKIYEVCNKKQNKIFDDNTKEINNKQLLFHGSPVTNWFSILKNGFYINPTQVGVPINGKLHGNGVYFSNHMSFSFPYCNMGKYDDSKVAILGLCEVALCQKSVSKAPIFVIFNTNQYTFRYLIVVENKIMY